MERIADILARCFEFDVWVFSQWWVYVFVFPAMFYLAFFMLKWCVLTAPVWLPVTLIIGAAKRSRTRRMPKSQSDAAMT